MPHGRRTRHVPRRLTGLALAAALLVPAVPLTLVATPASAAAGSAVVDDPGCREQTLARNDDGSTGEVELPFVVDFLGSTYSSLYVNNNGNVTFDRPLSTFTPFGLEAARSVIVAPFFADVDTRGAGSGVVTYGDTEYLGRPAFCVDWVDVGYFPTAVDKTNSFQLMVVDRGDVGTGDVDLYFHYDRVTWETGGASGGTGGLGGSSARVGFSNGSGRDGTSFELRGSGDNGAFLDSNPATGLVNGSLGSTRDGVYLFRVRGGAPQTTGPFARDVSTFYGFRQSSGYADDPVNTASGNYVEEYTDLVFPGRAAPLSWRRTYNSLDATDHGLGAGWTTEFDAQVVERGDGSVRLRERDGRVLDLEPEGSGGYTRPEEFRADLAKAETFSLRYDDGSVEQFDAAGRLALRTAADGSTVRIERDDAGRALRAVSSAGPTLDLDWSGTRLTALRASDGRTVRFEHDDERLVSVTAPDGGVTRFETDDEGRVTRVVDASGVLVVANEYDSSGRVAGQVNASGYATRYTYAQDRSTAVTDEATGVATTYRHDDMGRLVAVVDPLGAVLTKTYDERGDLRSLVDRLGAQVERTWDDKGNLTSVDSPGEGSSSSTYDDLGRVTSRTDRTGATTTFDYDGSERLPSVTTSPTGAVTRQRVSAGVVLELVDPDGVRTAFEHDALGQVTAEVDGAGGRTEHAYDAVGRVVLTVDPTGGRTATTYDVAGRVLRRTLPSGGTERFTYDAAGRPLQEVDADGGVRTSAYDDAGRLVSETDEVGLLTRYRYDTRGQLVEQEAPGGGTTRSEYGPLGRLLSTTDPVGAVTRYEHDANGNTVATVDALGGRTTSELDDRGRLERETDALGRTTRYVYDAADRIVEVVDAAGGSTRTRYDGAGRVVEQVDPAGGTTTRTWTPAGRLASETDPTGRTTLRSYDAAGRLATVTAPGGGVTRFERDAGGRVVAQVSPSGLVQRTTYDPSGNVVAVRAADGGTTRRTWSDAGRAVTVTSADGGTVRYGRDAAGRETEVTDALGGVTRLRYDDAGLLAERVAADGAVDRYAYDAAGRRVQHVDPLGRVVRTELDLLGRPVATVLADGRRTSSTYDAAGRLVRQVDADGVPTVTEHDLLGRVVRVERAGRQVSYRHDAVGRVLEERTGDGPPLTRAYDAAGRRTQLGLLSGDVVASRYDADGLLASVTHPVAGTTVLERDADGRIVRETGPGVQRRWDYASGRLVRARQTGPGPDRDTVLVPDVAGRTTAVTEGGRTTRYAYDAAGQLVLVDGPGAGADEAYAYDGVGNRTRAVLGGRTTSYTYDAARQLRSTSTGPTTTTYEHDLNGRRTAEVTGPRRTTTRYDGRGLPVEVERRDGGSVSIERRVVDPLGRLVEVAEAGTSTQLTWDSSGAVPQVVALAGGVDAEVLHTTGPAVAVRDGRAVPLSRDAFGSVLRTAGTEQLVRAHGYDVFGRPADEAGRSTPAFGYRGELHVGGSVHLRARDLDPSVGAFQTPDPLEGVTGSTTVSNPYTYADGDPVGSIDPLGLAPVSDGDFASSSEAALPQRRTFAVPRLPGFGRVRVGFFIQESLLCTGIGFLKKCGGGDGRSFDPSMGAYDNRVYIAVDFQTGRGDVFSNTSCNEYEDDCKSAVSLTESKFRARTEGTRVQLRVNVENSLVSLSPRINAELELVPTGYSQVCAFGEADRFPSIEIYHDLPGSVLTLLEREQSSLGVFGLAGPIPNFQLPPCITGDVPLGPAPLGGVPV